MKYKHYIAAGLMICLLLESISGCGLKTEEESRFGTETLAAETCQNEKTIDEIEDTTLVAALENDAQRRPQSADPDAGEIADICKDFYQKAAEENKWADMETIRGILACFGENGYPAVDSRNQINMTHAEQVTQFCEAVDAGEEAEITIIEVAYTGGFVRYDLRAEDGNVDVVRSYYRYEDGALRMKARGKYQAEHWDYTEDGYLMFSGVCLLEELYMLTGSGATQHTALRVQPLEEEYREWNRKYLLPIGYERNNMFLSDWSEDDFGELDFYDLFDIFYPKRKGEAVPYTADDNLEVGAVYRIPKEEFESVIMSYFNIDSETLQSKTTYFPEDMTYEYRPRGFYEVEYPEYPYPEVIDCVENSDGTIVLTVQTVFPHADFSRVAVHEVVVRPLADGGVQYVSNRIIQAEDDNWGTWYTPRLTEEEWQELYGK